MKTENGGSLIAIFNFENDSVSFENSKIFLRIK